MNENVIPKWQRELRSFVGIKSGIILEGNVYDEFPRFQYEGDGVNFLDTDNMDQTILSLVKEDQTDVFFFDPVDGFYCYENSIEAQRKMLMPLFEGYSTNEITKNHGCTVCLMPSEKKKGCKHNTCLLYGRGRCRSNNQRNSLSLLKRYSLDGNFHCDHHLLSVVFFQIKE